MKLKVISICLIENIISNLLKGLIEYFNKLKQYIYKHHPIAINMIWTSEVVCIHSNVKSFVQIEIRDEKSREFEMQLSQSILEVP